MIDILGLDRLAEAPAGLLLLLKTTVVLAIGWLTCGALARANPRWRVLTWRATAAGLAAVAGFAFVPPLVTWRVDAPPRVEAARADDGPLPIPSPSAEPGLAAEEPPPRAAFVPVGAVDTTSAGDLAEPPAMPAPVAGSAGPIDMAWWLTAAWLAGLAAGLARFAVGSWGLARVVRRSSEAPAAVVEACRATAAAMGVRRAVAIVVAPEVASPCLAGVRRPTILMPAAMGLDAPGPDLDAVLVHELTHVRNGDLIWNDVLHLASIVLWFHPLAWRSRTSHAAACDAVCDAVAVDRLGDVTTYGRALARLALRAAAPSRGLAMARACDVRRRIESLQRMVYRSPLPRRLVMPALLLSAALAALVGGAAVIRAQDDPAKPVEPSMRTLVVRVLDDAGAPLEGVEVAYRHVSPRNLFGVDGRRTTAADGSVRVEYDPARADLSFSLTLRKPGFVPAHFDWSGERRPIQIPEAREVRLARGTTIGGVVTDDSGKGIAGAVVILSMPPTESDVGDAGFTLASVKTDAEGRWRIDDAPDALQAIHVRVEHPHYRWSYGRLARGLDGLTAVLKQGGAVTGSVVGPGGRPVAGARVTLSGREVSSNDPEARTDERGAFTLENCNVGPGFLIVQAEGCAPESRAIVVAEKGETTATAFALEAGSTINARVVDVQGRPVVGAYAAADRWQGRQAIEFRANTDADGRFEWRSAPKDAVPFDVFLNGYMRARQVPLIAGEEKTIVLGPALTISGAVTDAKTGRPIPKFLVFQGRTQEDRDGVTWRRDEPAEFTGGRYLQQFDFPSRSLHLLIEAPGYKPVESRAFRSDEAAATQDFVLEPQPGIEGVVLLPDGRPAAGADVAIDQPGVFTTLKGDRIERYLATPLLKTGDDGRFWFPKPEAAFLVVAAHAEGFALVPPEEFAKPAQVRLQRWARIEGRVMVGKRPGAGEEVTFQPDPGHMPQALGISGSYYAMTRADAEGRFVLDKVVPFPGYAGRVVVTDLGEGSTSLAPVGMKAVEARPGETTRVDLGGHGRPVVGRVVLDGRPDVAVDWIHNEPAQIVLVPGLLYSLFRGGTPRPGPQPRYAASFDAEGRFRADDLPPGPYRLTVDVAAPGSRRSLKTIARGVLSFKVPEGDAGTPVDVGEVIVRPEREFTPGDEAPAPRLDPIDAGKGR